MGKTQKDKVDLEKENKKKKSKREKNQFQVFTIVK